MTGPGLKSKLRKLLICTAAATAVEYGLIASGIAVTIIPVAHLIGINLKTVFTGIADDVGSTGSLWPSSISISFDTDTGIATISGDGVIDTAALLEKMAGHNMFEIEVASGSPVFNLTLTPAQIALMNGQSLGMSNGFAIHNGSGTATINATLTPPAGGSVTAPMFGISNILDSGGFVQGSFRSY